MPLKSLPTVKIVVALAVLDGAGQVLMQRRPANKAHGGLWEFPGGKVEAGETCEGAVVRESDEELGIGVDVADLFPVSFAVESSADGCGQLLLLLFATRKWLGVPKALEAGSAIAWVSEQELFSLEMPPLDIPLARAVIPFLQGVAKAETAP